MPIGILILNKCMPIYSDIVTYYNSYYFKLLLIT